MSIRPLQREDVPALGAALARLPLMQRYRRDATRLRADLTAALSRGDGLLVEEGEGGPRGLAWFLRSGTLGMGGYLRLIAVAPEATGSGVGARLLQAFEAEVAR
ncbi:MAG TPA: GNAT family N-acetyltransferase, partial [Anaeromyxobacteraceae bacterium]